ncbi:MAG: tetratricopeptide repeat protein [Bacteroidetes bacterium]|nr:tetratricopeptide repeat protein [Bacteroidota bacterium]
MARSFACCILNCVPISEARLIPKCFDLSPIILTFGDVNICLTMFQPIVYQTCINFFGKRIIQGLTFLRILLLYIGLPSLFAQSSDIANLEQQLTKAVDSARVDLLVQLCRAHWYSQPAKAIVFGNQALAEANLLGYHRGMATASNVLGVAFDVSGKPDSALHFYQHAYELASEKGFRSIAGSSLNNQGMIFHQRGNFARAAEVFYDALQLFRQEEGREQMIANVYNNLGLVYDDLRQYERSLEYHREALAIRERLNDQHGIAASLNNLGNAYHAMNNYPKALQAFESAYEIRKKLGDAYGLGIVLNNLAEIHQLIGNYERVINYSLQSLRYRKSINDEIGKSHNYNHLAHAYLMLGNTSMAKWYIDSAFISARKVQSLARLAKSWKIKSAIHRTAGEYDLAFQAMDSLLHYNEVLSNNKLEEKIAELEVKFDTERKKQEIEKLNKDNQIKALELAKEQARRKNLILYGLLLLGGVVWVFGAITAHLKYRHKVTLEKERATLQQKVFLEAMAAEDRERQRIAMELHDGLGQLLSAALLNLRTAQHTADDQFLKKSETIVQESTQELRRISKNLMPGFLVRKGLGAALEELADSINGTNNAKIELLIKADINALEKQTQHTLYRVVQEMVNNILKHNSATKILIALENKGKQIQLTITDNGQKWSEPSPVEESKGIGLMSILKRAELLSGKIWFGRLVDGANTFTLAFNTTEA